MRGKWCVIAALLVLVLSAVPARADTVSIIDMAGRRVDVPGAPERIVCIGPGALRLIVYLQAQDQVVGVEDMEKMNPGGRPYWIAHSRLKTLPRCGPGGPAGIDKKPDMEALLALAPEVIFITYMSGPLADDVQRALNIPVVVLSYGEFATFDETVYDALRIAGRVLGREARAEAVIDYIGAQRDELRERTAAIPAHGKPAVYVGGIGYLHARGIESSKQHFTPFEWVNADNRAATLTSPLGTHLFVDRERLLRLDPDIIFIDGGGLALVAADYHRRPAYYKALRAFADRRVYSLLPYNWYTTNIDTALADAFAVGKVIYPEAFADVDPEQKADEIYLFFVGQPVYAAMRADYGAIGRVVPFLDPSARKGDAP